MREATLLSSLLLLPLSTSVLAGQTATQRITGEPVCTLCRIERHLVVTITDSLFAPGALGPLTRVHVTEDGQFLVYGGLDTGQLYLTNPSGMVTRSIGRKGSGPGEFRHIDRVEETDRSLVVLDGDLRRMTTLSKADYSVETTYHPPHWSHLSHVAFPDGRYVFSGLITSAGSAGFPVHLATADGTVLRSFGKWRALEPGLNARVFNRQLAVSRDGALWVAHLSEYHIEKWDTAGTQLRVIERLAPWFAAIDPAILAAGRTIPRSQPAIFAVYEDRDGLLWTHIVSGHEGRPPGRPGPSEMHDTIIEILDPIRGSVVASLRMAGWLGFDVTGGFYQSSYRTSLSGEPLIDVWGFRLVR